MKKLAHTGFHWREFTKGAIGRGGSWVIELRRKSGAHSDRNRRKLPPPPGLKGARREQLLQLERVDL